QTSSAGATHQLSSGNTSSLAVTNYVVPTGRVIVHAGRYIVPIASVIVATGRYIVPAGSDHNSDNASIHNEALNNHQQTNIQPQIITTVSNNNAKFPYLKKDEYERELKARTTLLQSIPDDHIADFHYMDDARDIWNAVKARFRGNAESKKMRKSMLKTGNVIEDVLQSFVADTEPEQQLAYEDLEQIEKLDLEEMDLKWLCFLAKGGNDNQRYSSFKVKEIGKKEEDSKALITIDTLVDWSNHDSESDEVITAKEFGMIAGCDSADAIKAGANKLYNLINRANSEEANTPGDAGEFALMGVTSESVNPKPTLVLTDMEQSINLYKFLEEVLNFSVCVPTFESISASFTDVDTLEVDAQEESVGLSSEDLRPEDPSAIHL
nr:xylulose kinase-1 [Tanacetum cinerariifolium]